MEKILVDTWTLFGFTMVLQRIMMEETDQLQGITAFVIKTNLLINLYKIKGEKNGAGKDNWVA